MVPKAVVFAVSTNLLAAEATDMEGDVTVTLAVVVSGYVSAVVVLNVAVTVIVVSKMHVTVAEAVR